MAALLCSNTGLGDWNQSIVKREKESFTKVKKKKRRKWTRIECQLV